MSVCGKRRVWIFPSRSKRGTVVRMCTAWAVLGRLPCASCRERFRRFRASVCRLRFFRFFGRRTG